MNSSFYEWSIKSTNQIIFPFMNLLVHQRQERLICFDSNVSNNVAAIEKLMDATGGKGTKIVRQDFRCQQITCCQKLIKKLN